MLLESADKRGPVAQQEEQRSAQMPHSQLLVRIPKNTYLRAFLLADFLDSGFRFLLYELRFK